MNKSKTSDKRITKIYAIVLVTAVVLLGVASYMVFNKPATAQVSDEQAVSLSLSDRALDRILAALGLGEPEVQSVGAVTGPFMPFDHIQWGLGQGIRIYPTAIGLKTATTTICAIQSPVATSTLVQAGILFSVSATTTTTIDLAKAATAFATTTAIGGATLASDAEGLILASTTPTSGLDDAMVFAPNTWFVVGMQGNDFSDSAPVGVCHATFESYSI